MIAPLVAIVLLASPEAMPRTFSVVPGNSTLTYHLTHRFHGVTGVSRTLEGKARILPDGDVQVMVRAPLASFDSGERNRDANMRDATGAAHDPFVVFKGVGHLVTPAAYPSDVRVVLRGELTLKTARPIEVEVALHFDSADHASARAKFPISLEDHKVERPSLLLIKVDDHVVIDAELELASDR
ncbi:MAG TPA: YceI family protein [Anaeromyxobacteraceae bacterium]|nr:YceI family protein [Anaeromyxobacteraceae bacterium]